MPNSSSPRLDIANVLDKFEFDGKQISEAEAARVREAVRTVRTNTKDKPP